MPTTEDVIISFKARDNVSKVVQDLQKKIQQLTKINEQLRAGTNNVNESFKGAGASASGMGENVKGAGESVKGASSSVTNFSNTIRSGASSLKNLGDALYGVHSPFEKFLGFIGSGSVLTDLMYQASMRQSNQIMLGMNKSKEAVEEYYNAIQQLVISLPGNDDFLNNLLVQISSMDQSISIPEVEDIGNVVSDYYMLARAKGQTNFETEREIRNYLLTGSTLALQNSVISSQIKTLKNINNITDRAIALQKAMQAVGMDGIAHYDSYNNVIEMFRGRFQKAFADLGTPIMQLVQAILKLFIELDKLTNSGATYFVITFIALVGGLISAITTLGIVIRIASVGIDAFFGFTTAISGVMAMESSMLSLTGITNGFTRAMFSSVSVQNLDNATKLTNIALSKIGIEVKGTETVYRTLNGEVITEEVALEMAEGEVIATSIPIYEAKIGQKIRDVAMSVWKNTVSAIEITWSILKRDVTLSEAFANNVNAESKLGKITATILETTADMLEVTAGLMEVETTVLLTEVKQEGIAVKIIVYTYTFLESLARFENITSIEAETLSETLNTMAKNGNIVAKGLSRVYTISESVARWINSISIDVETASLGTQIKEKLVDLALSITGIVRRGIEIAQRILKIGLIIAETVALVGLTGAVTILDAVITTATGGVNKVIAGILLLIIGLIVGVYELGKSFGWWSSIMGVFEAIGSGLQRIWDAFVNSEPIQKAITSFQNFFYTIQTLFNFIGSIGGGIWELLFGVGDNSSGGFDIVSIFESIVEVIANVLYYASGLFIIVDILDAIGSAIAWVLDTWNQFIDSPEMQAVIVGFQEIRVAIGEIFDELSSAFADIGEAFGELFGGDEENQTEETEEGFNILLEALRAFAMIINTVVVPAIKLFLLPLKIVADTVRMVADTINWFVDLCNGASNGVGNLGNSIVNEFTSIPSRIMGTFLGLPNEIFGGLVDGVLNILGIHSPGFIQEAVVNEFLNIPSRILGGLGFVTNAVGSFASAIWGGFDSIFGTNAQDVVDGFFNGLTNGFNKLKEGDIIGAVKEFGDNFLKTLDNIFGQDISGMVGGFFNQISSNFGKLMDGDILGALNDTGNYINDSIKRFTGIDINGMMSGNVFGFDEKLLNQDLEAQIKLYNDPSNLQKVGLMQNPQNLVTGQTLTQNYNNATSHNPTIVNNNFGEGSVQADARNMSAKDVQTLFTGAFGYNKARGTEGILK